MNSVECQSNTQMLDQKPEEDLKSPLKNVFMSAAYSEIFQEGYEQFLGKFCSNVLPLNLSVTPNMMHFVRTFSILRALGVRLIVIEKV